MVHYRKKYGSDCKISPHIWAAVDWSKSNLEIQTEIGCPSEEVKRKRWGLIDWSKSDAEISAEMNSCIETTKKRRAAL